jgi:hypothetical protein
LVETSFGRQLWKLSLEQDIAWDSLQLAAEALRLKWKARGLNEDVLLAVQREVCSVQPEPQRHRPVARPLKLAETACPVHP